MVIMDALTALTEVYTNVTITSVWAQRAIIMAWSERSIPIGTLYFYLTYSN